MVIEFWFRAIIPHLRLFAFIWNFNGFFWMSEESVLVTEDTLPSRHIRSYYPGFCAPRTRCKLKKVCVSFGFAIVCWDGIVTCEGDDNETALGHSQSPIQCKVVWTRCISEVTILQWINCKDGKKTTTKNSHWLFRDNCFANCAFKYPNHPQSFA